MVEQARTAPARAVTAHAGGSQRLQADGYTVYAPPNPLRGLVSDSATLADFLKTIPGPVILMLGCLDCLPSPHRSALDVAFGLCSGSALVLETGVLARDFADANTPVPGGGFQRGSPPSPGAPGPSACRGAQHGRQAHRRDGHR
jgi:hypothetical protein